MAALTVDGAQPLDDALVALPQALRELEATAPIATDLVDRLDRLAVAVTPALPDLAAASRDAVPVLENAIPVLVRATPIIEDTRQLATRLGKAKGGLIEMFDLLPPTLKKFDKALDVITMDTVHGAPAYRQLLAAFVGFDGIFSGLPDAVAEPAGARPRAQDLDLLHPGLSGWRATAPARRRCGDLAFQRPARDRV